MTKRNMIIACLCGIATCGAICAISAYKESTETQETESYSLWDDTTRAGGVLDTQYWDKIAKLAEEKKEVAPVVEEEVVDYSIDYNTNTVTYYTAGGGSYTQTLTDGSTIDFMSQGVLYEGDTRYTYYSSNVAYHYRTPEWNLGDDGIYRTNEGYVVVASSDYEQGTIIETPFGTAQVLDCGCANGTVDVYTGF